MKKIKGIDISDNTEREMLKCASEYGVHAYSYMGYGAMILFVHGLESLNRAMSAQDYLSTVCPEFRWFASLDEWCSEGKVLFVNNSWVE